MIDWTNQTTLKGFDNNHKVNRKWMTQQNA